MGAEPFLGSVAVARGLLTRGHLRGPRFRRLFPDVYIDATVPITPSVRARAAALFVEGRGAAAGFSAAELLGASCGPLLAPDEVVVPGRLRTHPGLVARKGSLEDTGIVDGVRVMSPLRTGWDLARRLDLVEAVVAVDALAAQGRKRPTFVPLPAGSVTTPETNAASRMISRCAGFDPGELLARKQACPRARGVRGLERVPIVSPRSPIPGRSHRPRPGCGCSSCWPGCPFRRCSSRCSTAATSPGSASISPIPRRCSPSSTTARTTTTRWTAPGTGGRRLLGWHTLRIDTAGLHRTRAHTVQTIRDLRARREHMLRREGHTSAPST